MISPHPNNFENKSIALVTILCIATFGLYVIYRLYQLTTVINHRVINGISTLFVWSAISIHLTSLLMLAYYFLYSAPAELLILAKVMHLISSIFHVIWIFKVKNRINEINNAYKGNSLWLKPFLSAFFHVIYFQMKINQSNKISSAITS